MKLDKVSGGWVQTDSSHNTWEEFRNNKKAPELDVTLGNLSVGGNLNIKDRGYETFDNSLDYQEDRGQS